MDEFFETVPVVQIGKAQTVVFPENLHFDCKELKLRRMGDLIMLFPEEKAGKMLREALNGLPNDLFDNVEIS